MLYYWTNSAAAGLLPGFFTPNRGSLMEQLEDNYNYGRPLYDFTPNIIYDADERQWWFQDDAVEGEAPMRRELSALSTLTAFDTMEQLILFDMADFVSIVQLDESGAYKSHRAVRVD